MNGYTSFVALNQGPISCEPRPGPKTQKEGNMTEDFNKDPRSFAIELLEEGLVDANTLVTALVKYMSTDDVKECLDANELSPRFMDDPHYPYETA